MKDKSVKVFFTCPCGFEVRVYGEVASPAAVRAVRAHERACTRLDASAAHEEGSSDE